jgi:ferredoxin--NADP+ reductase
MICGSPSMLKETLEMLDAKGFKVSPSLGQMGIMYSNVLS